MRRLLAAILLLLPSMAVAQGSFAVPTYTAGSLGSSATVATPSFSPGGGSYSSTQTVTISTATSLAVLCYTTDGSTPTESGHLCSGGTTSTYSTPISVATTQTVKAIGTKATYTDSAVGSAAYTISAGHVLTVIQKGPCSAVASSNITCTLGAGFSSGDTAILYFMNNEALSSSSSVGTLVNPSLSSSGSGLESDAAFLITGIPGGSTTFTVNLSATNYRPWTGEVYEVSGVNTTTPLDSGASSACGWNQPYSSSATCPVTTTAAYDAVCGFSTIGTPAAAGTGYTLYSSPDMAYNGTPYPTSFFMECTTSAVTPGTYTPGFSPTTLYTISATISLVLK